MNRDVCKHFVPRALHCAECTEEQPKERALNTEMNGRRVKRIWWSNGESLTTEDQRTLFLAATCHGDRDEFWVVQYEGNVEIARHNCRYIETIEWA